MGQVRIWKINFDLKWEHKIKEVKIILKTMVTVLFMGDPCLGSGYTV